MTERGIGHREISGLGERLAGIKAPLPRRRSAFHHWPSPQAIRLESLERRALWPAQAGVSNFCTVLSDSPSLFRISEAVLPKASSTWFLSLA